MQAVFSDRSYIAVMAETTEKIKTETGGLFLGAFEDGVWYIVEAIDPGPGAVFEVAYFEYDRAYTEHLINKIANLYDEPLHLIGLWHRHPGSFDRFSTTDHETNAKFAQRSEYGAISAIVNVDPAFRLSMFHVGQPCRYTPIEIQVGDRLVPERLRKLKRPNTFEQMMKRMRMPSNSLAAFMRTILPWLQAEKQVEKQLDTMLLNEGARDIIIEAILDDLTYLSDVKGIGYSIRQDDRQIRLEQDHSGHLEQIRFTYSVPLKGVVFSFENDCREYRPGMFAVADQARKNRWS